MSEPEAFDLDPIEGVRRWLELERLFGEREMWLLDPLILEGQPGAAALGSELASRSRSAPPSDLARAQAGLPPSKPARGSAATGAANSAAGATPDAATPGSAPPEREPASGTPAEGAMSREQALAEVREEALVCRRCKLAETRRTVVFGEGSAEARLMFVGEGPGADEDAQGRPFVGRAGRLLTKIIEAIDLRREDVYIANVLKCRPPNNRDPHPDEVACCLGYLERQIEIIQPKVICTLGSHATRAILGVTRGVGSIRGRSYRWQGIDVVPTWHPAYLLRNPAAKRDTWDDIRLAQRLLVE